MAKDATHLYISCGSTDFRKQIDGLVAMINLQFKLDPFTDRCVFIFCNKRKNSIKVLCYDNNGFILASKKLLDGMKFQWPKNAAEVKEITPQQLDWLLQGLSIEQKKALHPVKMSAGNTCF
ncbi:IS66 family insertion sequence element accessory protein TnpB [Ruminiclostridium cellobioparum]|uniref:IS66 family insertion sequence element accessory protein TnpB n=1 Tax=Ruminiclostridium cellobioparum TaxID=29355 RepID=UPI0028A9E85F|nr:IS66 family insertion sequence element accessory protein TnpB [Ruminiclostridium cellobioparum]